MGFFPIGMCDASLNEMALEYTQGAFSIVEIIVELL